MVGGWTPVPNRNGISKSLMSVARGVRSIFVECRHFQGERAMSSSVLSYLRHLLPTAGAYLADEELLHRFTAEREEAAFTELLRRYGPLVWGVCRRVLGDAHAAEDAF